MPFVTVQYELFLTMLFITAQYGGRVMYYSAIQSLSGSITVQELFQVVSLVTVPCDVICSGNVSYDWLCI